VSGLLLLAYLTSGGVNAYQEYLFSAHMLGHMGLTMAVPVLLVPGAPVTLIARAVQARKDGSRGGREWVLLAVHSKFAGII
ncbi:cytochrome c oxidase assembly protein, partial [Bacillus licheniformis]